MMPGKACHRDSKPEQHHYISRDYPTRPQRQAGEFNARASFANTSFQLNDSSRNVALNFP